MCLNARRTEGNISRVPANEGHVSPDRIMDSFRGIRYLSPGELVHINQCDVCEEVWGSLKNTLMEATLPVVETPNERKYRRGSSFLIISLLVVVIPVLFILHRMGAW